MLENTCDTVWIFDLDHTLYPSSVPLLGYIDRKIAEFCAGHYGISLEEAHRKRMDYHDLYGTTLHGLLRHGAVDPQVYLEFVHDVDYECLMPDEKLGNALQKIIGRKFVYTNGTKNHAEKALGRLRITHHFEDIFAIECAGLVPKPDPAAFQTFLQKYNIDPHKAIMFEDKYVNLQTAASFGLKTALIPSTTDKSINVDYQTDNLADFLMELL